MPIVSWVPCWACRSRASSSPWRCWPPGQNSSVTATLAGQVVMEGFLDLKMPVWLRRLTTRAIAIVPAIVVIAMSGEKGLAQLLILSQVVLSLQLPFAVIPLVLITRNRAKMGGLASPGLADRLWRGSSRRSSWRPM